CPSGCCSLGVCLPNCPGAQFCGSDKVCKECDATHHCVTGQCCDNDQCKPLSTIASLGLCCATDGTAVPATQCPSGGCCINMVCTTCPSGQCCDTPTQTCKPVSFGPQVLF